MADNFPPTEPNSNTTIAIRNAAVAIHQMLTDQATSLKEIHSDLAHIGELLQDLVKVASALAEQQKSK
jgi:hypothetical protein